MVKAHSSKMLGRLMLVMALAAGLAAVWWIGTAQADATSTSYSPGVVNLTSVGASTLITVQTVDVDAAADGVQVNVQHSSALSVATVNCVGLFQGGSSLPVSSVAGGTLIGCFFLAGDVNGTTGDTLTFLLTRESACSGNETVNFGFGGPAGTEFSDAGSPIGPGSLNDLLVECDEDFGDAPDTYGTLLSSGGPSHVVTSGINLGPTIDAEADGQPSAGADGDDLAGLDDEDGLTSIGPLVPGAGFTLTVDGGPSGGFLNAWMDFDGSGTFETPSERFFASSILSGPNVIGATVPISAAAGSSYLRLRLHTGGVLLPTGPADDGEVEDHLVQIGEPPPGTIIIGKITNPPDALNFGFTEDITNGGFSLNDGDLQNFVDVPPGTYLVSENDPSPDFNLTGLTCDDPDNGSSVNLGLREATIDLDSGETIICNFTNTFSEPIPGTIIIEKVTTPSGGTNFGFAEDITDDFFNLDDGGSKSFLSVAPGVYEVSEDAAVCEFLLTAISCDDNDSSGNFATRTATIVLGNGETVTCTFTNAIPGTRVPVGGVTTFFANGPDSPGQQAPAAGHFAIGWTTTGAGLLLVLAVILAASWRLKRRYRPWGLSSPG